MPRPTLNSPLAEALNSRIQPKLVEIGWSVGDENSPLGEYICLMMVNGKSQDQIASELSGELLGLDPDDASSAQFARWLFDEFEMLKNSMPSDTSSTEHQNHHPLQNHQHHLQPGRHRFA